MENTFFLILDINKCDDGSQSICDQELDVDFNTIKNGKTTLFMRLK